MRRRTSGSSWNATAARGSSPFFRPSPAPRKAPTSPAGCRAIAASAKWIEEKCWPSLSLVYLPHLDYDLQRFGLDFEKIPRALGEIDAVVGGLIRFYEQRGIRVIILSEYGITSVDRPVHLNRL